MRVAPRTGWVLAALALGASLVSVGLALVAAPPAETAGSKAVVSVTLDEWKLVPAPRIVPVGAVTIVARNDGTLSHELVVIQSGRRAGALPVKGGKAVETGRRARIAQIAGGTSKRLTLTLAPGRYVLLCNVLGHYQAGQFATLRVRQVG